MRKIISLALVALSLTACGSTGSQLRPSDVRRTACAVGRRACQVIEAACPLETAGDATGDPPAL